MATPGLELSPTLASIDGQVQDLFRALSSGFQKLDKVKDPNRQSKQLEELTMKMREAKRLIKDFDREIKEEESKNTSEQNKQLNEKKQALIKELNSYVALRKTYTSALGGGRNELLEGGGGRAEAAPDDGVKLASSKFLASLIFLIIIVGTGVTRSFASAPRIATCARLSYAMTNQQLIDTGRRQMDETDQTLERSKQVVQDTVNIGEQTALTLKSQTEQMGRIVNELDTIQFSIKKASQLVKEISRQLATDKCIMVFLLLIVCGVIAIIIVKVVNPKNKSISNLPGFAPPVTTTANRRLLLAFLE